MLYFWFLRLIFIFCFSVVIYVLSINFTLTKGIYFTSSVDSFFWLMFSYPVMWISLLLYKYELNNSDNDLARIINTQSIGITIQYIVFLHIIAFTLYNVSHGLSDLSIHYFLDFLRYCALAYILYEFVIGVLNMFYGILYEIAMVFKPQKKWK